MGDFLCHAATFARIEDRLKRFGESLSPLVVSDDRSFTRPWGGQGNPDGEIEVVYATQDSYFSPAARDFFRYLIEAPRIGWFQSSAAGLDNPAFRPVGLKAGAFTSAHEQSPAIAEWVLRAGLDQFQGGPARRTARRGPSRPAPRTGAAAARRAAPGRPTWPSRPDPANRAVARTSRRYPSARPPRGPRPARAAARPPRSARGAR